MPQPIHERIEDWLAAALAEDLSPEERRALDTHLADCERCRTLSNDMTMTHEILQREFAVAVGPAAGFETRLAAGFRRRLSERPGARLTALLGWLIRLRGVQIAGAAALLLALVEVGSTLTGDGMAGVLRRVPRALPIESKFAEVDRGKPEVESKFVEITQSNVKELKFDVGVNQSNGVDLLRSPSVTTKNGSKATVPVTREFTYPTQFQPPQIPKDFGRARGLPAMRGGDTSQEKEVVTNGPAPLAAAAAPQPVTPTTPTNFEKRSGNGVTVSPSEQRGSTDGSDAKLSGSNTDAGTGTLSFGAGFSSIDKLVTNRTARFAYGLSDGPSSGNSVALGENGRAEAGKIAHFYADLDLKGQPPAPGAVGDSLTSAPASTPSPSGQAMPPSPPAAAAPTPAPETRKLIRNARAELEVPAFDAAVDAITAAATQDGGYIDTKNSARGANGKLSGTLVIKVLPDNLDRFLQRLRALGEVKNQTVQAEDITKAYYDTDARLRNSRRMEDRLLKMLEEVKGKMSEVLQVEKELGRVRSEIEQMQGELKLYDFQVSLATVSLRLYEKDLNQPAAFLLRETANLSLLAADVEKTYAEARRVAEAVKAQVLSSNVNRDSAGRISAVLNLLVAPEQAGAVIAQTKALGRVQNYTLQDERIPQNGGSSNNAAAGAEAAKVERAPVAFNINIAHDEQTRRQVSLRLIAKDVDAAFDKARAAVANAGGEMVNSSAAHPQEGHASAQIVARVPARGYAGLLDTLKTLGRAGDFQTQRDASGADTAAGDADDSPTLLTLNLADAEPAVQQTRVRVQTADVERRMGDIKQAAIGAGAEVSDSTFVRESNGGERAEVEIRLPMGAYPALIERVRALGEVKDFTVLRHDRPTLPTVGAANAGNDAGAPAEISLNLYSRGRIVGESSGVAATVRRTFGQGVGALMWSVQMIGVALAFLAPWIVAALLAIWAVRRVVLRRRAAAVRAEAKPEAPQP